MFLFDGLRLYEPYHLKDFQTIATIINSNAIGGTDFYTGAYPAHYGDRMSGVLSIDLRAPEKAVETELALSFFNTSVLSIGTFGREQRGDWLVTARRGNLDLIVDVVDPDVGSPDYRDYLGHVGWEFGPRADLSADFLVSDDKLTLADAGRGERATASYSNQVFWPKWRAAYTELRWRPADKWVFDLGLRWDQQNYTTAKDDKQYSPRASVLYQVADRTEIRLGWGQYHQAQEINELQASDGIADFFPAQRAEHFVLNVQQTLKSGIDLNLSAYRKSFRTIRPRFENTFNTLTLLPELQFDRVRVDASGAEAIGAELMFSRGSSNEDLIWWLGYTWSEVKDTTPAGDVKRSWDQTHTVKAGLSWRWGSWDFSAAGEVHTGWPRTLLSGETVLEPDGSTRLVLDVSDRNASRHSVFHTLDARVSREFDLSRGDLTVFLEITNLYDRANPCCAEYSLQPDGSLASREAHWLPLVPSLGVVWRF